MNHHCDCRVTLDDLANYVTWQALEARLGGPVPIDVLSDLQAQLAAVRLSLEGITTKLIAIDEGQRAMSEQLDTDYAKLTTDLHTLADAYVSVSAALKDAQASLAAAGDHEAAALASQDAGFDAQVVAADAIADAVLNPPAPPADGS